MSGPLNTDALIHDLAIVLGNALHSSAQLGLSGTMAARRIRDVLGIKDGERNATVESRLREYLAGEPLRGIQQVTVVAEGESHPGEVLMYGPTWVTVAWAGRTADCDPRTGRAKSGADIYYTAEGH